MEVTKSKVEGGGGMQFTKPEAEVAPPFQGRDEDEQLREPLPVRELGAEEKVMRAGKVPLHPAAVRLPASIAGRVGFELTGYSGFVFTEAELNDLAELWCQCGVEMSPLLQASIATSAMMGAKSLGYFSWVKQGKPPLPGAKSVGEDTLEKEE